MKKLTAFLAFLLIIGFSGTSLAEEYDGVEIPEGASSFADEVVSYNPNPNVGAAYSDPQNVLGEYTYVPFVSLGDIDPPNFVSLGDNGVIVIRFTDNSLTTSGDSGNDLWLFEMADVEPSNIAISIDGTNWIDVGSVAGATAGVDIDAYLSSGVTLWEKYSYVKVTDAGAGYSTQYDWSGVDINAIAAISSDILNEANDYLPKANAGPDQQVEEGEIVTLNGTYSIPPLNGSISSYEWVQIGSGTAVTLSNANTATATFTAPATEPEALFFQLTVTDNDGDTDTDDCAINVAGDDYQMPTASINPSMQTVEEGEAVTLQSNSTDPDGNIVSYSWTQVSGSAVTISGTGATITFISPNVGASGETLEFELVVTDNDGLSATANSIVNVSGVNEAPMADAGDNQNVALGATVTLDGSGSSDPDIGDTITGYSWRQVSGGDVTLSDPTATQPTFIAPNEIGSLEFELTVTDNGGLSGVDVCIVNVTDGTTPTADAGPDQIVIPGSEVTLDGTGSTDGEGGTTLEYFWRQVSAEGESASVLLSDPTSSQPTFTFPSAGSTLEFELVVTDSAGLKDSDTVIIAIPQIGGDDGGNCFIDSARWMKRN